jgi:hypothetical protein
MPTNVWRAALGAGLLSFAWPPCVDFVLVWIGLAALYCAHSLRYRGIVYVCAVCGDLGYLMWVIIA